MTSIMFRDLCLQLGYTFKNKDLLAIALRHCSVGEPNNERLEFLGDSVLNLVIAEYLYTAFPKASEGQLSRLRARLVCQETLSDLARTFKLGEFIELGLGEIRSGGHQRDSILADAFEALLGCLYLENTLEECRVKILGWFEPWLKELNFSTDTQDAKTKLQEYCQAKRWSLPIYELKDPHQPVHVRHTTIIGRIPGTNLMVEAEGISRKKAEQQAARLLLELLKNE